MSSTNKNLVILLGDCATAPDGMAAALRGRGYQVASFQSVDRFLASHLKNTSLCVLIDVRTLKHAEGQLLRQATPMEVSLPVLVMMDASETERGVDAVESGASDFILKPFRIDDLDALLKKTIMESASERKHVEAARGASDSIESLTARETEVFGLLVGGQSNKLIAEELTISHRTVELHRSHIFHKLGVHNLADLVHVAVRAGIVSSR